MLRYEVNIFKNAIEAECSYRITVGKLFEYIKAGRWANEIERLRQTKDKELRIEIKKQLPAVTFSGIFFGKRLDTTIKKYTGIIVLDIDKSDPKVTGPLKKKMEEDEYCFCSFYSPSMGLKCLFEVDVDHSFHKEYSFAQVKDYFERKYNVQVDKTGCNLSRLCFVSYDADLYFSENKTIFPVTPSLPEEEYVPILKYKRTPTGVQNSDYSFKVCKKWVEDSGSHYVKGERNIYLYKLCCNLNRAGFQVDDMIYYIHKEHSISREMRGEVISCARSAAKNKNEFNIRPIWLKTNQENLFGTEFSQTESNE